MVKPDGSNLIKLLLVSSIPETRSSLEQISRRLRNWRLDEVTQCRKAVALARQHRVDVAICEEYLRDGDWKVILQGFEQLCERPRLIVTSRLADEALWAEVLNLGGYDVLQQPFEPEDVCRVVISAWQHNERRDRT